ncbi:unnamed protein product [Lupinus luteus]|uniref:Pentatricopeptide repeat-containing protein n=1 Tax=Lupinus luteus TaxID=3873 RepID=A0AAV1VXH6_LUPLU
MHGNLDQSLQLLNQFTKKGLVPNAFTYSFLVEAAYKERGVDEAVALLDDIIANGGMPNLVSYNVLLTGLCKEGRTDEAIKLFREMPAKGGASSKGFPTMINDMVYRHKVSCLALFEVRVIVDQDSTVMDIEVIVSDCQFLYSKIHMVNRSLGLYATFIYGSPNTSAHFDLWSKLTSLASNINELWFALGDFNAYLEGFKGPPFTWEARGIKERLKSDQKPWLFKLHGVSVQHMDSKCFRFMASWFTNESFHNVVKRAWNNNKDWILAFNEMWTLKRKCGRVALKRQHHHFPRSLSLYMDFEKEMWLGGFKSGP